MKFLFELVRTALRHSIITYFNSLDDGKDSSIRKSLVKHSVRYQESVYNEQSNDERPDCLMIRNKIAQNVFGNVSDVEGENSNDSDDFELKPRPGDIVTLLDPVSSEENVEFFLAKIARYSESRNEIHLIHLERLKDNESPKTRVCVDRINQVAYFSNRLCLESDEQSLRVKNFSKGHFSCGLW